LPRPEYDRNNVYGTVLSLFQPKDKKYCTALELIAGMKLNHVVVKDKLSAKPLNEANVFKIKTTIIPLKELRVTVKNPEEIKRREDEFGVRAALNVINFD
jgi:structural maintenance of chromosome 2